MPISDFLDMMPDEITHRLVTAHDAYGKPAVGGSATYRARVCYETRQVKSFVSGQDVLTRITVWVGGLIANLSVDSQITLPDGTTPKLESWEQPSDESGGHHMKLYFT